MQNRQSSSWIGASLLLLITASPTASRAMDRGRALELARQYLEAEEDDERDELAAKLADYEGPVEPLVRELSTRNYEPVEAGYLAEQHFSASGLEEKHPEDLLYFTVPRGYRPDWPTGLIIFMHGGGRTSERERPSCHMDFPEEDDPESSQMGDIFDKTGMVAVGPSAPWNKHSAYRWCLDESEEYLADVILECKHRFHIDSDRVFLVGHSMGGFGAYHHLFRQPDRFAAVIINSGSWSLAYWPVVRGTPFCVIQGVHDAVKGERWHYTDIEYARWTDKLLKEQKLDYTYYEHDGGHGLSSGREYIARYLKSAEKLRRDACPAHVVLASPLGFDEDYCFPVEHNRWLTLNETRKGKLEYDELVTNGADEFDDWRLRHRKTRLAGAAIDATNRGDNTIVVKTRHVERFTIWLHPRMIDVANPVTVLVDGKPRFRGTLKPSLLTALESYLRRHDWGLVYPMKIGLTGGQ